MWPVTYDKFNNILTCIYIRSTFGLKSDRTQAKVSHFHIAMHNESFVRPVRVNSDSAGMINAVGRCTSLPSTFGTYATAFRLELPRIARLCAECQRKRMRVGVGTVSPLIHIPWRLYVPMREPLLDNWLGLRYGHAIRRPNENISDPGSVSPSCAYCCSWSRWSANGQPWLS